ncbi:MAG: hypothetical protein ACI9EW_002700 [Cellvibrionaceae bacterium]|jgi:hypothetical protein
MRSNRKLGCGGCILLVVLIFGCIGTISAGALYYITNSEFYAMAVEAAQENPRAIDVLGAPIEGGLLVTQFSVERSNGGGTALIEVPVSGPKSSGTVHLNAVRSNDAWVINTVELEVNGERFSLGR